MVITAAGAGIVLLTGMLAFISGPSQATVDMSSNENSLAVTIVGLKDAYKTGEQIKFSVKANGISDLACNNNVPYVRLIQDSTGKAVWSSSPFSVNTQDYCFNSQPVDASFQFGNEQATHRAENGMIALNEQGSYTLSASFDGKSVEEKIVVAE